LLCIGLLRATAGRPYTFPFDKGQRRVREKFFSSPMCIFAHALD